jgi:rubrerythrin
MSDENIKLTHDEVVKTLGFLISAEYKIVKLYMQIAASIDDEFALQNLREMIDEDKNHAGVLLEMLQEMAPETDFLKEANIIQFNADPEKE